MVAGMTAEVRLRTMRPLSRRSFLAGSAGLAGVTILAACGGDDGGSSDGGDGTADDAGVGAEGSSDTGEGGLAVVRRFPPGTLVPGIQRLPVALGDSGGTLLPFADTPAVLLGDVLDEAGSVVAAQVQAPRHGEALQQAYFPFPLALDAPGVYQLKVTVGDTQAVTRFDVVDAANVQIPKIGEPLPPVDTPTTANARGVDPICTRQAPCPFHDLTLREALGAGKPVVYLIGTPAHCKTAVCGPVLDYMIAESEQRGDAAVFVHADVYTDDTITTIAPAVEAYRLTFEPVLFLADATGTLVQRLDAIWDDVELRDALDQLLA
jgi:hypothetical protein